MEKTTIMVSPATQKLRMYLLVKDLHTFTGTLPFVQNGNLFQAGFSGLVVLRRLKLDFLQESIEFAMVDLE